jgi:hypothetical protein
MLAKCLVSAYGRFIIITNLDVILTAGRQVSIQIREIISGGTVFPSGGLSSETMYTYFRFVFSRKFVSENHLETNYFPNRNFFALQGGGAHENTGAGLAPPQEVVRFRSPFAEGAKVRTVERFMTIGEDGGMK